MALFISESERDTFAFAKNYAKTLHAGDVLLLEGDLGAGKTVFAKGVAAGLEIPSEVTSPTYAYVNDYDGRLFHFDCYRVPSEEFARAMGFSEYFSAGGICLVEWGENIKGLLPAHCKRIKITGSGNRREIEY